MALETALFYAVFGQVERGERDPEPWPGRLIDIDHLGS